MEIKLRNKANKTIKNNRGITLIALVITIIVLLILAGVTIATLTGDNGLLKKAQNAKQVNEEAEICEQLKLVYAEYQIGHYSTEVDVESSLKGIYGNNVSDVSLENGNQKLIARVYGKLYQYNSQTGIAEKMKPVIGDLVTKSNYGDYIDLGQSVVGDDDSTIDDWRILYNDTKEKVVYVILADYLPNNNPAVITSGLNALQGQTYNVNSTVSRQDLIDRLDDTTAWQSLISSSLVKNGASVRGAIKAEILIDSYNEKYGTSLEYTSQPFFKTNPNDSSSSIDTLYMPHPANFAYWGCYSYWLSSPYKDNSSDVWNVSCAGYFRHDEYNNAVRGVCPVVVLPSNIQVTSESLNGLTVWKVEQQ